MISDRLTSRLFAYCSIRFNKLSRIFPLSPSLKGEANWAAELVLVLTCWFDASLVEYPWNPAVRWNPPANSVSSIGRFPHCIRQLRSSVEVNCRIWHFQQWLLFPGRWRENKVATNDPQTNDETHRPALESGLACRRVHYVIRSLVEWCRNCRHPLWLYRQPVDSCLSEVRVLSRVDLKALVVSCSNAMTTHTSVVFVIFHYPGRWPFISIGS